MECSRKWTLLSLSSVTVGVTLGTLKVEYDLCIMSFREGGGISAGEMYRLKTSNASPWKGRLALSFCQFGGREGISSGMNNPLSGARSFRTTSSKESY
jgi:hypothetical protein